jgi:hypothetical protein
MVFTGDKVLASCSVRVDNSSLLDDLLTNTAYRTMSSVKSYIDSEVLASESYYVIYIIVIAIRCGTFYYIWWGLNLIEREIVTGCGTFYYVW